MVWSPGPVTFSSAIFHNVTVYQCYFLYFNALFAKYIEVNGTSNKGFFLHKYEYWMNC